MMWLVVGGPATVVVAGFATLVLAVSQPDPLVDGSEGPPRAGLQGGKALQPALQGRNHAATPAQAAGASSSGHAASAD